MSTPSIVAHWRRLSGAIHEDDEPYFNQTVHSFNLDYPPPAYVGDIINAPVVLLEMNGGYDPSATPTEFAAIGSVERYLDRLHNPRPVDMAEVAPYYASRNYAEFIKQGVMALVNAVAYRTDALSRKPVDLKLAKGLPSTGVHLRWLRSELLAQAKTGDRLVIAHRNSLWGMKRDEANDYPRTLVFSRNPVSADLAKDVIEHIGEWA